MTDTLTRTVRDDDPPIRCERCNQPGAHDTWCDGWLCDDCEERVGQGSYESRGDRAYDQRGER